MCVSFVCLLGCLLVCLLVCLLACLLAWLLVGSLAYWLLGLLACFMVLCCLVCSFARTPMCHIGLRAKASTVTADSAIHCQHRRRRHCQRRRHGERRVFRRGMEQRRFPLDSSVRFPSVWIGGEWEPRNHQTSNPNHQQVRVSGLDGWFGFGLERVPGSCGR